MESCKQFDGPLEFFLAFYARNRSRTSARHYTLKGIQLTNRSDTVTHFLHGTIVLDKSF